MEKKRILSTPKQRADHQSYVDTCRPAIAEPEPHDRIKLACALDVLGRRRLLSGRRDRPDPLVIRSRFVQGQIKQQLAHMSGCSYTARTHTIVETPPAETLSAFLAIRFRIQIRCPSFQVVCQIRPKGINQRVLYNYYK